MEKSKNTKTNAIVCVCGEKPQKKFWRISHFIVTVFLSLFSFDLCRPLLLFFFSIEFPFGRLLLVYFIVFVSMSVVSLYFLCHFVQLLDCMMRHKFDWLFFNNVNKMFYHWCVCVCRHRQFFAHIKKRKKAERKRIWKKKFELKWTKFVNSQKKIANTDNDGQKDNHEPEICFVAYFAVYTQ